MIKLICGVSRAGKTTYSQQFENVIHLDDVAKIGERYAKVIEMLGELGEADVVIEGIYDAPKDRMSLLNAYKGNGKKICIWLDPSEEEINSRPWAKRHGYVRKHSFTSPTYSEGWDEIIRITHNDGSD